MRGRKRAEAVGRAFAPNEFRTNRRRQWRLRRESGLFRIGSKGSARGLGTLPALARYASAFLSNSLKSLGLPLPRLAFMHWPTR